MPIDALAALFAFAVVGTITPGPNNIMLLASGANFGFRRTVPHIVGIELGFVTLMAAIGVGLGALLTAFPTFDLFLKIAGGLYLVYLAWKIANSRAMASVDEGRKPLSVLQAALFQLVNPKAWVMSISAMAVYTRPEAVNLSVAMVVVCFGIAGGIASPVWAAFGTALRQFLAEPVRLKWFNIGMGTLLVATLVPMLL